MPLRCLLFCSDAGATDLVIPVLTELRIDAELCPNAITATDRVTSQSFQIVILDWDDQPDAGLLLSAARTRKASERPLTLAIVGDDAGVPKALQAGANSVIRRPILVNQVRDTLTTARDLLRAKLEQSVATAKTFVAKSPSSPPPAVVLPQVQSTLRAGEFLQSSSPQPGAEFSTESDLEKRILQSQPTAEIDPLEELEPTAAAVDSSAVNSSAMVPDHRPAAPPPSSANPPRGLAWYKARAQSASGASGAAAAPALAPAPSFAAAPPAPAKTELLNYEQTPAYAPSPVQASLAPAMVIPAPDAVEPISHTATPRQRSDQKTESELFAYMAGEQAEDQAPTHTGSQSSSGHRWVAVAVLCVAVCGAVAYWKLPQSLWKPGTQRLSARVASAVHDWLNPQPVTPAQAPASHENFARAGDEYKMPVAPAIPDATTDPSQIHVIPVVDPTAKQPNSATANANVAAGTADATAANASAQPPAVVPDGSTPVAPAPSAPSSAATATQAVAQPAVSGIPTVQANSIPGPAKPYVAPPVAVPAPQRNPQPQYTASGTGIPSSLKSQMASSTPDASGNKPADAAMPSIEPVTLAEAAARSLLVQQPAPAYPDSAKGQSGMVVLQVFIARDGTVQDAKFVQGSLVFARAAIDAVKQWHFQPYLMNGRPVSTVTSLTLSFRPAN